MTITNNPYFGSNTSDDIKRGFSSISSMFAPPSGADLAGYASARESRAKADLEAQKLGIIEKLKSDPHYSGADAGILADLYDPNASFYAVDKNNATELAKNAADNQQKFVSTMYGPLSQDAMRPAVPADVAKLFDIHGEMPAVNGLRSALTETQVKGAILQGLNLTPEQKLALGMSDAKIENIVGPDGKAQVVYSSDAVGHEPAYAPSGSNLTVTTNPDGTTTVTQGGKAPTEGQSKDINYLTRGSGAEGILEKNDGILADISKGAATGNIAGVGNYLKTPEYRQAEQAGRDFLAALLRKDSGANITQSEFDLYGPTYLPVPGDDSGTIQQKRAARQRALAGIEAGLSPDIITKMVQAGLVTPGANNPTGNPTAGAAPDLNAVPPGWDPEDWKYLTDDEKAQVLNGG